MKIAICEDEQYWSDTLKTCIFEWAAIYKTAVECTDFVSPEKLLDYLAAHEDVDVLFLDISLGPKTMDGMQTAKYIRKMGCPVPIIFVTVESIRAADGYLVDAAGFLTKPIDPKRLALFLDKVVNRENKDRLVKIAATNNVFTVKAKDIVYVEINNHTVIYHTIHRDIQMRGALSDALKLLGTEGFVQIHRSYIISKDKIVTIKVTYPYAVNLILGVTKISLPVGRKYKDTLLKIYSDDILEKMI